MCSWVEEDGVRGKGRLRRSEVTKVDSRVGGTDLEIWWELVLWSCSERMVASFRAHWNSPMLRATSYALHTRSLSPLQSIHTRS